MMQKKYGHWPAQNNKKDPEALERRVKYKEDADE